METMMKSVMLILGMLTGLVAGCATSTPQPEHATVASAPKMRRLYDYCASGCKDNACTNMCEHIFGGHRE
jgi:hypothetical protein